MAIEVKLPNLGEGVDTGDILEVLVKEGDTVAKDQGLLEIETGKATMQVPSSASGKIAKIHVKAGQTISPGTTLVTLEGAEAGEKQSAKKPAAQPKKEQPAAAEHLRTRMRARLAKLRTVSIVASANPREWSSSKMPA